MFKGKLTELFNSLRGKQAVPPEIRVLARHGSQEPETKSFTTKQEMVAYIKANPLPAGQFYDISGQDFSKTDLTGLKLPWLRARGTNFKGATLNKCDLTQADLSGALLDGAKANEITAHNADFTGADMRGTKIMRANLTGAVMLDIMVSKQTDFENTDVRDANARADAFAKAGWKPGKTGVTANIAKYRPADNVPAEEAGFTVTLKSQTGADKELSFTSVESFALYTRATPLPAGSHYDLEGADLSNMNFQGAHLDGSNLAGAILTGTDFSNASMPGVTLDAAQAGNSIFRKANLAGATAKSAEFESADMNNCDMSGCDMSGSNFSSTHMNNIKAVNNNFTGCCFKGAKSMRSDYKGAVLLQALADGKTDFENSDFRDANYTLDLLNDAGWKPSQTGITPDIVNYLPALDTAEEDAEISLKIFSKQSDNQQPDRVIHFKSRTDFAMYLRAATPGADEYYDLRGYNLSNLNLGGANFHNAIMTDIDLSGADVTNANFDHAQMQGITGDKINFTGASLKHVIATGASFKKANFTKADISHADFTDAVLKAATANDITAQRAMMKGCDMRGTKIMRADLRGANLTDILTDNSTDFENADIRNARANPSAFDDSGWAPGKHGVTDDIKDLADELTVEKGKAGYTVTLRDIAQGNDKAAEPQELHFKDMDDFALFTRGNAPPKGKYYDLSGQQLGNLNFQGANLDHADMTGSTLTQSDFTGAKMDHVRLDRVIAEGVKFSNARMRYVTARAANMAKANMTKADLIGGDFSTAILKAATMNDIVADGCVLDDADMRGVKIMRAGLKTASLMGTQTNSDTDFENSDVTNGHFTPSVFTNSGYAPSRMGSDFGITKNRVQLLEKPAENGFSVTLRSTGAPEKTAQTLHFARKVDFAMYTRTHRMDGRLYYDLKGADLTDLNFAMGDLFGAELTGANLTGSSFAGARLSHAKMDNVIAPSVDFQSAKMAHVTAKEGNFKAAKMNYAVLSGGDFTDAQINKVQLQQARAIATKFTGANLKGTKLIRGNFQMADFSTALVNGDTDIEQIDLRGAEYDRLFMTKTTDEPAHRGKFPTVEAPDATAKSGTRIAMSSPIPMGPVDMRRISRNRQRFKA